MEVDELARLDVWVAMWGYRPSFLSWFHMSARDPTFGCCVVKHSGDGQDRLDRKGIE
jgi:hypothetical protein